MPVLFLDIWCNMTGHATPLSLQGFMKAGPAGTNKEQLKEMLAILNTGPKRPSFLDKPPVIASVGRKQTQPQTQDAASAKPEAKMSSKADKLLELLESEHYDIVPRWVSTISCNLLKVYLDFIKTDVV
jgi:hypothetical protein